MTATNLATAPHRPGRSRTRRPSLAEAAAMLRLATPIALVSLVNMAMSVTDTLMAAGFGAGALAAVAVGSDFYSIVFYLAAGTISGLGPYYAAALAAGDADRASRLRLTGWLVVGLCAILAVPVVWLAPRYLGAAGLDRGLLADGASYTQAMALTVVPMLLVTMYRTRLSAEERPGLLLRVTLAAVPLNAALNYALMYGIGGWAGLGIVGAGLSSVLVASFIAAILMGLGRPGAPAVVCAPRIVEICGVLQTGIQIGVATVAEVGIFLGATLFAATLGPTDVAAHAIAIRAAGLAYALPSGLLQAATVRVSRAEGLGSAEVRRIAITSGLAVGGVAGLLLFLLLATAAALMPAYLFAGHATAGTAAVLLLLVALYQLFDAPGAVAAGILRSCHDTRAPMLFSLTSYWGISAPLGLWLATAGGLGAVGIWIALAIGTAVASSLLLARLRRHRGGAVPARPAARRMVPTSGQSAEAAGEMSRSPVGRTVASGPSSGRSAVTAGRPAIPQPVSVP